MTENQKIRTAFQSACLSGLNFKKLLKDILPTEQSLDVWLNKCSPSNICHSCKQPIEAKDFTVKISYWTAIWLPSHKACAQDLASIIECQTIDADCNDCKHFKRDKVVNEGTILGTCLKYGDAVYAHPNFCSGHKCFEHRRAV